MRILITTFGTRGDIQPYIALGNGLRKADYEVGICTSEGYQAMVESYDLHYIYMSNELLRLTQAVLGETGGMRETMRIVRQMPIAIRQSMDDEWRAATTFQPDLIIYHPKCLGSLHVAEKLRIPAIMSIPLPFYTPTSAYPVPFMSNMHMGGWFNRFSYRLIGLSSAMYVGTINNFRAKTLAMPSINVLSDPLVRADGSPVPIMYCYSPHVIPRPADYPSHVHVTGYWFVDHPPTWQPDPALVRFLESGTPPVYVGFGSVGGRNAEERSKVVFDALERSGQRGVLVRGWGGLKADSLPTTVFMLGEVPHDWLFPQMAAVIHHGGAGTTAAGLRAGKPTIICPFMADQPFWGAMLHRCGVGTAPIPQRRLTADRLAEAITTAVQDQAMRNRAANLGEKICAEDGIGNAVRVIQAQLP